MEYISSYLSERMVVEGIISEKNKTYYEYSIQGLIEKMIVVILIFSFAVILHRLVEVASFLLIFASIRKYSDGVHCRTSLGCFCASVAVTLSTILIVEVFPMCCAMWIGGVVSAMVVLCKIATIPHPELNLTEVETEYLKSRSRIVSFISGTLIVVLLLIPSVRYIASYMALGVIYNALGLMILKSIGRWDLYEKKEN